MPAAINASDQKSELPEHVSCGSCTQRVPSRPCLSGFLLLGSLQGSRSYGSRCRMHSGACSGLLELAVIRRCLFCHLGNGSGKDPRNQETVRLRTNMDSSWFSSDPEGQGRNSRLRVAVSGANHVSFDLEPEGCGRRRTTTEMNGKVGC